MFENDSTNQKCLNRQISFNLVPNNTDPHIIRVKRIFVQNCPKFLDFIREYIRYILPTVNVEFLE